MYPLSSYDRLMRHTRSDAARSRARILEVARTHDARALRLNEVARDAGVGVGTVYRHFPTVHALVEALSLDNLERMLSIARAASMEVDAARAFADFLSGALALQLEDGGLQSVLLSPADEDDSVRAMKLEVFAAFESVLQRARVAGVVRADLSIIQLEHLVCGVEHAVRIGDSGDRQLFLDVLLTGLRPRH
jgi:AcrR family transcriptional regulator